MKAHVVGGVCESGDYFCKDRPLPKAGEGDYLALLSAGAYGFVMASNYNTRPLAAEILVNGRRAAVARRTPAGERNLVRRESCGMVEVECEQRIFHRGALAGRV
jgi:diaminopimelate decarboxylase